MIGKDRSVSNTSMDRFLVNKNSKAVATNKRLCGGPAGHCDDFTMLIVTRAARP
jgi:hypothetical protein